ncbi:MAG TPA: hypothetical protein VGB26_06485 [Nitrospiria bacterium]|jgi:hypothetical protein
MENLENYLENLQKKLGLTDSENLADRLSIPHETLKGMLRNQWIPNDELCLRIAYLSGDDPALVLAIAHFSTAKLTSKPFWEKILLKLRNGRVFSRGYRDRRSWNERRLLYSKPPPPLVSGSTPERRQGAENRRMVMDRRLPSF